MIGCWQKYLLPPILVSHGIIQSSSLLVLKPAQASRNGGAFLPLVTSGKQLDWGAGEGVFFRQVARGQS